MARWVIVLSVVLAALPAQAQDAPPDDASASGDTDTRRAQAGARFDDATALFERGDYPGALAEMATVYDLLDGSPDRYLLLYNLGRLYESMHRYDRAVSLYRQYLDEAPPDGPDRAEAEASLHALERFLGTIVVEVDVPCELWIGGERIGDAPGEIAFAAGSHTLELRAAGYETHRTEVRLNARERVPVAATMRRIGDVQGISPVFFGLGAGVAALALGVGIGFGVHALSLHDSAIARGCGTMTDACGDPRALMASVQLATGVADALYVTAGVFALVSVVLAFVTDWDGSNETSVSLAPVVGPGLAGLSATCAF